MNSINVFLSKVKHLTVTLTLCATFAQGLLAPHANAMLNPITDISWKCMFPLTIAGVTLMSGEGEKGDIGNPICVCKTHSGVPYFGLKTQFWEPSRLIDTVSEPYNMMLLGTNMGGTGKAKLGGSVHTTDGSTRAFQQMHYYMFPIWQILDMFTDIPCIESEGFDIPIMTELVPTWNNDTLAMIMNPEAILFGNPVSAIACSADSVAALVGKPIDYLFWCMGSWGNVYPLAGSITSTDYVEANAGLAARAIYFAARTALLWEDASNGCTAHIATIWSKSRYRLQLAKPNTSSECLPIGRDALLWGAGAHDLTDDNFLWTMFTKRDCCARYY